MTTPSTKTNKNKLKIPVEDRELEKLVIYPLADTIACKNKEVISRVIVNRITGSISIFSFDTGTEHNGKYAPFDTFIQVIEGSVSLTVKEKKYALKHGEAVIIPANTHHHYKALEKVKIVFTVIKSGYEGIITL